MRASKLLLSCCLAASLSACSLPGSDPVEEARAAFDAQDYITAQGLVQQALAADAENSAALELLARIQLAMGQGDDVLATLERLQELGPDHADLALLEAEGHLQAGDAVAALALIGSNQTAEAWRLRALAAVMQGDVSQARQAFAEGRNAGGPRGKLLTAEASFHLAEGDTAAASEAVALAQEVAPERVETLFVSARLAEAQADAVTALSNYLKIIETTPMDRPALIAAIGASERAGLGDVTRHLIEYGAQTRPLDREFVYQQARVEAWDGRWEAVRERLQAHEAELGDHDSARLLYAEALLQLGQVETARAIAAPIVARRGSDPEALRVQAAIEAAS